MQVVQTYLQGPLPRHTSRPYPPFLTHNSITPIYKSRPTRHYPTSQAATMFALLAPLLFALSTFAELQHVAFPHLIIPLKEDTPTSIYGTQTSGEISHSVYTEISFDVPSHIPAAICRINFHINTSPIVNAPRSLSGEAPYTFIVYRIVSEMDKDKDSWAQHPEITNYVAAVTLGPKGGVEVKDGWFQCPYGDVAQFVLIPASSKDFRYTWFELDYGVKQGGPHGITLEMHT
jgi:hypothetical protein